MIFPSENKDGTVKFKDSARDVLMRLNSHGTHMANPAP